MDSTSNSSAASRLIGIAVTILTFASTAAVVFVLFCYPIPGRVSDVGMTAAIQHGSDELSYMVYNEEPTDFEVTVIDGTKTQSVITDLTTVYELLDHLEITVTSGDELSHSMTAELYPGMDIAIVRYHTKEVLESEKVAYETIDKSSAMIAKGTSLTWRKGVEGTRESKYNVTYRNDKEVSRELLETALVKDPVDEIVLRGETDGLDAVDTKEQTITVGGKTYSYEKAVDVTATAYTCEGSDNTITFTGTTARVGAIAVDPKVIPLNSKLFIVAEDGTWVYGFATAEDTGGFIKGKRIDLYFDTKYECIEFGRQETTVYILEN